MSRLRLLQRELRRLIDKGLRELCCAFRCCELGLQPRGLGLLAQVKAVLGLGRQAEARYGAGLGGPSGRGGGRGTAYETGWGAKSLWVLSELSRDFPVGL